MRKRNFRRGDEVRIATGNYPVRYLGRTAPVVGRTTVRGRTKFLLDFSPRREEPLEVSPSHLEIVE